MASNQLAVLGQYQGCAVRAYRLQNNCLVSGSANNAVTTTAIARANLTPELKAGIEVEATTACGTDAWVARTSDRIKSWTLELDLCLWDYELIEMLVGGSVLTGNNTVSAWNNKTIGWAAPGFSTTEHPGVCLEIYSKVAYESGDCPTGAIANPPAYVRHIFPKYTPQLADRPFTESDAAFVKLTGKVVSNPKIWADMTELGDGVSWLTNTTIPQDSAYVQVWANALPNNANVFGYKSITVTPGS